MSTFRVGTKVPLNVYEDDRPIFQTHTPEDAARLVGLLNAGLGCEAPTPHTGSCGCRVAEDASLRYTGEILYCPLHAAARELLRALKALLNAPVSGDPSVIAEREQVRERARAAIAKAAGGNTDATL